MTWFVLQMISLVASILVLGVYGAEMTLESMAAQVVHRVNPSGSHVTYDQMRNFITANYDRDNDGCVSYAEFAAVWTVAYHDSLDVATKFVTNMDMDHDGCLDDIEVLVNGVRNNQHLKIGYPLGVHDFAVVLEVYHPSGTGTGSSPDPGVVG